MNERQLREQVVEYSHRLHANAWVANHDGNVTVRLGPGRTLATPTATSKAKVAVDNLLVVDDDGKPVTGRGKPFSEIGLHLTTYVRRADVSAVVHAHPPHATAIACAGSALLTKPFMAEAVVSLGPSVPTVPFATPGHEACSALAPLITAHDAVLIANHGVLTVGTDLEQAYLRMELVEHLARIAIEAEKLGGVRPLPESMLATLLEARQKAGLGARSLASPPGGSTRSPEPARHQGSVAACAPSPDANVDVKPIGAEPRAALADIIREELVRALRER